jgi:hypothetical protein
MKNISGAAFILAGVVACSSSDPESPGSGGSAQQTGGVSSGGSAGKATGGSAGASTGGASGSTAAGSSTGGTSTSGSGGLAPLGGTGASGASGGSGTTTGGASVGGSSTSGASGSGGVSAGAGGMDTAGTAGMPSAGASGGGMGGEAPTASPFSQCPYVAPAEPTGQNYAVGTVTVFNDDGAWTWYSDERAVVDVAGNKIIVSSDANRGGRNGAVEVVIYDVSAKMGSRFELGKLGPDDHNNAAVLVKPDGKYLAAWAGHNENCNTYWRNHDGSSWSASKTFAWNSLGCPTPTNRSVTYNNLWNMTAENKIYNIVRSVDTSPNILVSSDNGANWTYGGRITFSPTVGYVAGYYKYWGNGVDRIDFFGTEAHPRDNDNSLYHGYIKGGKSYNTAGEVKDEDITGNNGGPDVDAFTKIFAKGTRLNDETFTNMWNSDVMRWDDGTIAAIGMGRTSTDSDNPDHSFVYMRYNGTEWKTTWLGKAGKKLYADEQDYVGLGALHPDDKNVVYISSPFDPRNGMAISKREIFKGVTCDDGATFQWSPVTWNSTRDNLRPIVPKWNNEKMVLMWFRGTYETAQRYNEEVVGIITEN